jgi:hypothetical protein
MILPVRISVVLLLCMLHLLLPAQTVIIDGRLKYKETDMVRLKDYTAELRSDDSILLEKVKVNSAGAFTFQLHFAHDYRISVNSKDKSIWQLLVHNKMEYGQVHYPVEIEIPGEQKEKDTYEVTVNEEGNKVFLKNGKPITETTFRFETGRRDSTEIIKKTISE